jgi:glutamate-1-semialdehyde 2,1-aminomutase
VISGFRVAFGGMVEKLGLVPDLVTYGKIIGGGLAVGAYAGRRELMDLVAPAGQVYQAGTLSANPLAMRTGTATLRKLKSSNVHAVLDERMAEFSRELKKILSAKNLDVTHMGSVFWLHPLTHGPIRSLNALPRDMGSTYTRLFHFLLKKGVYLAPSGYEVGFLSLAHDHSILELALSRFSEAVSELG